MLPLPFQTNKKFLKIGLEVQVVTKIFYYKSKRFLWFSAVPLENDGPQCLMVIIAEEAGGLRIIELSDEPTHSLCIVVATSRLSSHRPHPKFISVISGL